MAAALSPEFGPALWGAPKLGRLASHAVAAEHSLAAYIRLMWHVVEPESRLVWGWVIDCVAEHLEAISRGEIKKLAINVPPGCMKSHQVSVFWPTWEWGPRAQPSLRYLLASYSQDLTIRDNRRARALITSPTYQQLWGERFKLSAEQNAKIRFDTDRTGYRIATSVGGLGTGERGDRFIIDDPHNVLSVESTALREEAVRWFANVVPTRRISEDSAILVIMQRVHQADVIGTILKAELEYEWLCLPMEFERRHRSFTSVRRQGVATQRVARVWPERSVLPFFVTEPELAADPSLAPAGKEPEFRDLTPQDPRTEEGELLWPERFSRDFLERDLKPQLRAFGGTYAEAAQLQQRPAPRSGGMFHEEDFQIVDEAPAGRTVRGWDLAGTEGDGSYTVGVKMRRAKGAFYVLDVVRQRIGSERVQSLMRSVAERDGVAVEIDYPQDPGQAGKDQKRAISQRLAGFVHFTTPESGDKETRAAPLASEGSAGNLYLVRGAWNDAFIAECVVFNRGEFNDQVDAASRAFARLLRGGVIDAPTEGPILVE